MKKLICMTIAFILAVSAVVYAVPANFNEPSVCPECRGRVLLVGTSQGGWQGPIDQRPCTCGSGDYEYKYYMIIQEHYKCELCNYSVDSARTETEWLCNNIN